MNSAAASSSSRSMPPSWSGVYTNTSWIPLASAVTCTGTEMVHDETGLAVERGVEVGHHPHPPAPALVDRRLQRRRRRLLASGTERTRAIGVALELRRQRREVGRSPSPLGNDRDPPPGEWIQSHLAHSEDQPTTVVSRAAPSSFTGPGSGIHAHVARAVGAERSPVEALPPLARASVRPRPPSHRARRAGHSGSTTAAGVPAAPSARWTKWPSARWRAGSWVDTDSTTSDAVIERTSTIGALAGRVVGDERLDHEHAVRRQASARRRRSRRPDGRPIRRLNSVL